MSSNRSDIPVELRDIGDVVAPEEHLGADHARGRGRVRGGGARGRPVPLGLGDGAAPSSQFEVPFGPRGAFLMALLALLQGVAVEDPEIAIF